MNYRGFSHESETVACPMALSAAEGSRTEFHVLTQVPSKRGGR